MMGLYGNSYGYGHMGGESHFLCSLVMVVLLIDLILVGMWLWRRIKREDMKSCGMCAGKCNSCGNKSCTCGGETKKSE